MVTLSIFSLSQGEGNEDEDELAELYGSDTTTQATQATQVTPIKEEKYEVGFVVLFR